METIEKKQNAVIQLDKLDAKMLPELKGWREKQLKIVEENPFIEVFDNNTYEDAKKHRTALVTARTDIQKQDRLIASKITAFRKKVSETSNELIQITLPHEEKQQDEVKRYEAEKEAERQEKERIEQERKEAIQNGINQFYENWKAKIKEMTYEQSKEVSIGLQIALQEKSEKDFEEFEPDFTEKVRLLDVQLDEHINFLTEQEEARKERERLAAERAEYEKQKAKDEADRKAREAKEKAEREAEAEKLRKEREAFEAEKKKLAEEEAKRQAKIEKERLEREQIEAKAKAEKERLEREETERKRAEALKPDKEKLQVIINAIGIHTEAPELKDVAAKNFYTNIVLEIEELKKALLTELEKIK